MSLNDRANAAIAALEANTAANTADTTRFGRFVNQATGYTSTLGQYVKSLLEWDSLLNTAYNSYVSQLNTAYNSYVSQLSSYVGQLNTAYNSYAGQLNTAYNSYVGQLNTAYNSYVGQLNTRWSQFLVIAEQAENSFSATLNAALSGFAQTAAAAEAQRQADYNVATADAQALLGTIYNCLDGHYTHPNTITSNSLVPADRNMLSAGVMAIAEGVTMTIAPGSYWRIV